MRVRLVPRAGDRRPAPDRRGNRLVRRLVRPADVAGCRGGQVRVVAIFDDGVERRRAEVTGEAADVVQALEKLDLFSSEPS